MPLSACLSAAEFVDLLPISELVFHCPANLETHMTGGGVQVTAERAPMLWRGVISLDVMPRADAVGIENRIAHLSRPGNQFMLYDTRRPGPLADPEGLFLGAAAPVIASLPSGREMTLSALPPGYILSAGDYLAFNYGGGRRALHRIVDSSVLASAAGVTPVFEVIPAIRPGATIGTAVTLVKATCKAVLIAKDVDPGRARAVVSEGLRFSFVQDLRA